MMSLLDVQGLLGASHSWREVPSIWFGMKPLAADGSIILRASFGLSC